MVKWLVLLALLAAPLAARAGESNRVATTHDTVSLVSRSDAASGDKVRLGLLFRLAEGWHIYWRSAGDAGMAPMVSLTMPQGAKAGDFDWPAPQWFLTGTLGGYVETGTVLLPFTVTLPHPAADKGFDIRAEAHWLVCSSKICVPEQGVFALHQGAGPGSPSAQAPLFAAAVAALPRASPFKTAIAKDGTLIVTGKGLNRQAVHAAHFFPLQPEVIANAAPQTLGFIENGFTLRLKPADWKPGAALPGVLEITDPSGAMQALDITPSPGGAQGSGGDAIGEGGGVPATAGPALGWLVIAAFLGGLILNLMPCVFPVLALKALSLAGLGSAKRDGARSQAFAYTAGAVVAMLAIGILLLILRAGASAASLPGGSGPGWGFQFQSPVFVAVMAWLVFVIGLNFAGLFEFGSRFAGIGGGLAARQGLGGSFATGLLAVVVATPCTAPFMGGAIAAALSASPAAALAIFASLGLGVAAPFLLIGLVPGVARLLPRPGAWMAVLRQFMAFPMFGTAVWLLWVMTQEAGADGGLIVAGGAVLIAFALWLLRFKGILPRVMAAAAVFLVAAMLPRVKQAGAAAPLVSDAVPFSPAKLAALRGQGRPVFIDMSAAWCVTCLVNERVALAPASVRQAFAARHVTLMAGDWTRHDAAISRYLAAHGREGVPLYVFYPADHREPVVLPQILTPGLVKQTLARK